MNSVEREIATYSFSNLDRLVRREWGFFRETLDGWKEEGWDGNYEQFSFDENPYTEDLVNLVGIDLPLEPPFKEEIVDQSADYIYVQNPSGGIEQFPKGKRRWDEVMPLYIKYPVESPKDWFDIIKPRLNPDSSKRWIRFDMYADETAKLIKRRQKLYSANVMGGFMYLRAMMGPERLLTAFYDFPELIHDMMKTWLHLVKTCLLRVQRKFFFFKLLMGEDICYKTGLFISPAMIKEFLFPYYKDLIESLKNGQRENFHAELDTDGNLSQVIPLYMEIGFNAFRPFEVAAGNDVVEHTRKYPNIIISGGIDKRILSKGEDEIKKELYRIIPFMVKRGGYIPTCDHTVPSDVPYRNYLYYRKLITSMDGG